jgi:aminoglycoside 6'-N-acetyltransferase I
MKFALSDAGYQDAPEIAELCALLWPDVSVEEHLAERQAILASGVCGNLPIAIFIARDESGAMQGFIEVGMRSHADGCDPARPAGYIEGWFVREAVRRQGLGTALIREAERWARERGCREMASDTWLDHEDSQRAHAAAGFEVVDRCVHFRKKL